MAEKEQQRARTNDRSQPRDNGTRNSNMFGATSSACSACDYESDGRRLSASILVGKQRCRCFRCHHCSCSSYWAADHCTPSNEKSVREETQLFHLLGVLRQHVVLHFDLLRHLLHAPSIDIFHLLRVHVDWWNALQEGSDRCRRLLHDICFRIEVLVKQIQDHMLGRWYIPAQERHHILEVLGTVCLEVFLFTRGDLVHDDSVILADLWCCRQHTLNHNLVLRHHASLLLLHHEDELALSTLLQFRCYLLRFVERVFCIRQARSVNVDDSFVLFLLGDLSYASASLGESRLERNPLHNAVEE
mmetsp:Transcript_168236/g.540497  ORF Transcript_168236/g.540497 Transcript_168236/m.540497 type:complete len:302 (-) Transcript_168236:224-1129(-)